MTLDQKKDTRTENLDNLNVITKPYSLHFADSGASIYATNDGVRFDPIPNQQGLPPDAIGTTGEHIMFRMAGSPTLFVDDKGEGMNHNFNPVFFTLNTFSFGTSAMFNIPGYNDTGEINKDRLYVASADPAGKGIAYNDSNGKITAWFHPNDIELSGSVTSFAQLDDKTLVAFDDVSRTIWTKADLKSEFKRKKSIGLPAAGGSGKMYIFNMKNDIIAIMVNGDPSGDFGVWRSTDMGDNFSQLPTTDLPADLTCGAAPFGKVLIVASRTNGIYRFSGQGQWERTTFGLKNNLRIYDMTFKNNKFKNGKSGDYVFIATSDGVYRSDDMGQTWIRLETQTIKPIVTIH